MATETAPPAAPARPAPAPAAIWAALGVVYLVWGSTYLAIRVVVTDLPPFLSAAGRFVAGALILGALLGAARPRRLRVTARELGTCALIGCLLLLGGNGLVVLAETPALGVPSGIAALLVAAVPLLVVVLRAATGDRPSPVTVAGVAVGFVGLLVLVWPAGGAAAAPLAGSLLVVAAATSWSVGSFLSGRLTMPADPFVATVYEMAAGGLALLAVAAATGEIGRFTPAGVSAGAWVAQGYLVVAGSLLAFSAYVWLLHHARLSLVATYAYVNPVVAVALGALLLAEPVGPRVLVGGAVIIVGVALVVSTERPSRRRDAA